MRSAFGSHLPAVLVALAVLLGVSGCATRAPSSTAPAGSTTKVLEVREGLASYYGPGFDGRRTASGVRFNRRAMLAAHPSYPFGTLVRVTNLANGRAVNVRIQDRGPVARIQAAGVIIDVSQGAAERLGFVRDGRTRVRVEVVEWGR